METLENTIQMPDWKQWIPVYGLIEIAKAERDGKPTIVTKDSSNLRYNLFALEQAIPPLMAISVPIH